ncbi:MAG: hypothetical protein KAV87_60485, partial [Desulfobacteraceae bacterium]|nr:hypothetical protein [Desulfobacteraceae bacterium]
MSTFRELDQGRLRHIFGNQSEISRETVLKKGQLNKITLQPRIINEHVESSREVQSIVAAGNIVGQVFKNSQDNANGLLLTLESNKAEQQLDTFESYANSVALQAVWVKTGGLEATLETTIAQSGTQSMKLPLTTAGDAWEMTFAAVDYTGYIGKFGLYHTNFVGVLKVYLEDSAGNKKYFLSPAAVTNEWDNREIAEGSMTEDLGNALDTDPTDIIKIGFEVESKKNGAYVYVDNLTAVQSGGKLGLKLWRANGIPVDGVTSIDDATQYTKIGGSLSE